MHERAGSRPSGGKRFGCGELSRGGRHPWWVDALAQQELVSNCHKLCDGLACHRVVYAGHTYYVSVQPVTLTTSL
jgi:hypothetical protein